MDTKTFARDVAKIIFEYRDSINKREQVLEMYKKNSDEAKQMLTNMFDVFYAQVGETINEGTGFKKSVNNNTYTYNFGPKSVDIFFLENEFKLPKASVLIRAAGKSDGYEETFQLFYENSFIWKNETGAVIDVMYIAKMITSQLT